MQIREYQESDLGALRRIHATQAFDYAFPDLSNPLFLTKLVLTRGAAVAQASACAPVQKTENGAQEPQNDREENSEILGAAFLRLTAETYLLLNPRRGTPRDRWQWLLALHAATERDAWQRGLEDVHAWLPPAIATRFGKRIASLGWRRDDSWTPYCRKLSSAGLPPGGLNLRATQT
jgi:hypothetical protein